jgi:hypothetical protein
MLKLMMLSKETKMKLAIVTIIAPIVCAVMTTATFASPEKGLEIAIELEGNCRTKERKRYTRKSTER